MAFQFIDIHTHLNLPEFEVDGKGAGERARREGVAYINIGTEMETSMRAVTLAKDTVGVYATIGIHPTHSDESFERAYFTELGKNKKVVAIGECGLDYFRVKKSTRTKQEEVFLAHIELANELEKPLMLHIRPSEKSMDAYDDAFAIVKANANVLGNVHFFAGTYDIAKRFWDIGFTTSFTGVITFASSYDEIVKNAPLAMLHAETDAPYVAPVPFRGKRNEPLHVREVYKRIAELRGEDTEFVRLALLANAQRLFGITLC